MKIADLVAKNVKRLVIFSAIFLAISALLGFVGVADYRILVLIWLIQDLRLNDKNPSLITGMYGPCASSRLKAEQPPRTPPREQATKHG